MSEARRGSPDRQGSAAPRSRGTTLHPDGGNKKADGTLTPRDLLDSSDFRELVSRRWRTSLILTAALFVTYYGYILLVATNKALLSIRVGETTTLGIPIAMAVIVVSWLLTAAYVVWANLHYDPEAERLRNRVR